MFLAKWLVSTVVVCSSVAFAEADVATESVNLDSIQLEDVRTNEGRLEFRTQSGTWQAMSEEEAKQFLAAFEQAFGIRAEQAFSSNSEFSFQSVMYACGPRGCVGAQGYGYGGQGYGSPYGHGGGHFGPPASGGFQQGWNQFGNSGGAYNQGRGHSRGYRRRVIEEEGYDHGYGFNQGQGFNNFGSSGFQSGWGHRPW